jgi:hypothetical protein
MSNKRLSRRTQPRHTEPRHSRGIAAVLSAAVLALGLAVAARADVKLPPWMQQQLTAPLPSHDDKTGAVLLYSETELTVQPSRKLHRLERRVYRILRLEGQQRGTVQALVSPQVRVTSMHGWSAPATGKPYEVKDADVVEVGMRGAEVVTDLRMKTLRVPAAQPGSVVGFEIESEAQPYVLAESWHFQETLPVREAHFTLQMPPGWQFTSTWLNHAEVSPVAGTNQWQWMVSEVPDVRIEPAMAPWQATAGQMWLLLSPPGGKDAGPQSWHDVGTWYLDLARGRRDASPEIQSKMRELTSAAPDLLTKMRALATYVQSDVRYVAIELGIGGYQPHAAAQVLTNHYGDCKDKATLLSAMLKELGVDSTYLIVNANRGAVSADTPVNLGFNHAVLAIQLPGSLQDPSLLAVMSDPRMGRILIFDPTDPYTPLGSLAGRLQGGFGLLVAPEGGKLVQLPQLSEAASGIERAGQLTLDDSGTLHGEIREVLRGDVAARQRASFGAMTQNYDHVKAVESYVGTAFSSFVIEKATVGNLRAKEHPIEWTYSLEVPNYAKRAGELLTVRPRVLGNESSGDLETHEQRQHAYEFASREHSTDVFEIALPAGFQVDDLPPPVDADYPFASYHSKTEAKAHALRYTRTFEIHQLSVPVAEVGKLRELFRLIYNDQRGEAVLKRAAP